MDARQQLLDSLMRDLQETQLPERYTAAQRAQIEKNRKGQKDIDAGRAAIAENERLYLEAVTKRRELQDRINTVQGEIDTAGRRAKEDEQKAKQDDPWNQAAQYGKSLGVPAAGYVGGHALGHKFGQVFDTDASERGTSVKKLADQLRSIDKTSPASKAQVSAVIDTYDKTVKGRPLIQFAGPAGLGALSVGTQMGAQHVDDPYLKEGLNLAATAERTGAGGMMLQQLIDTLRGNQAAKKATDPTDVASIESARRQLNEGGKFKTMQGALDTTPKAPELPKPPEAPALRPNADRLIAAAKAAGAKGKLTKAKAAEWLTAANINDANRAAVATELGVGPGQRIASAVKRLASTPGKSSLIGPLAAAGLAYDSVSSDAEAAGASPNKAVAKGAAAATGAAGVTAGASYGLNRLAKALGPVGRGVVGSGGVGMLPQSMDEMTNFAPSDMDTARNWAARNLPEGVTDYMPATRDAREMAQVPERAPEKADEFATARSLQIPEGIPLPREDGELPPELAQLEQAAAEDPELAQALQELIMARIGDAQGQDPMQSAAASGAVASQQPSRLAAALRNAVAQR